MPKIEKHLQIVFGSHLTGTIPDYPVDQMTKILGFEPQRGGADGKTKYTWDFTIDGKLCSIWDFKGRRWSCWGDHDALASIFVGYDPVTY